MPTIFQVPCERDPIEIMDKIHDLSMDQDPHLALYGRCLKALVPPLEDWVTAEIERGTEYADMSLIVANTIGQFLQLYVTRVCKTGRASNLYRTMVKGCGFSFAEHIAACAEMDKEAPSRVQGATETLDDLLARLKQSLDKENNKESEAQ